MKNKFELKERADGARMLKWVQSSFLSSKSMYYDVFTGSWSDTPKWYVGCNEALDKAWGFVFKHNNVSVTLNSVEFHDEY